MRGLSLLDMVIILAVLGLLLLAASRDFGSYNTRKMPPSATAAQRPAG